MTKHTLSVLLLQDGTFDELWSVIIKTKYEQQYDVRFTYFNRASELVKQAREQVFDLIVMYLFNVNWDVPDRDPFDLLASLKHGKRILVTQGLNMAEQCDRAGITFFETPSTVEQFCAVVEAALKTSPGNIRDGFLIYIVDDDPELPEFVELVLKPWSERIKIFHDPEFAVQAFASADPRPDLIITDLNMPKFDGFELVNQVRRIAGNQKILMTTSNCTVETEQRAKSDGIGILFQPYTPEQLMAAVSSLLEPTKAQSATRLGS